MRAARYKILLIIVLLLAVGFALFRWWQGPVVPSYTLSAMPLVQNVVATGRVATVSRAQVGSEISGVVLQRLVQEGDQIQINIPKNTIDVLITVEEMENRRSKWQPRDPQITTGYLARYHAMVTSGANGAILKAPGQE